MKLRKRFLSDTPRIIRSKKAERFDADSELWDARQLGASPEHAIAINDEDYKALVEG
jgi:hypothetical protein